LEGEGGQSLHPPLERESGRGRAHVGSSVRGVAVVRLKYYNPKSRLTLNDYVVNAQLHTYTQEKSHKQWLSDLIVNPT